jgi:hypothetical protein
MYLAELCYTNPKALLQRQISFDSYMDSRMLVNLQKLDDAPPANGGLT